MLSTASQRLLALADTAGAWLSIKDKHGVFTQVNKRFCDILGYEKYELIGRTYLDITPPDDHKMSIQSVDSLLKGGVGSKTRNKQYIFKDGSLVWVSINSSAIYGQDGEIQEIFSAIQDVSAHIATQENMA